MAKVRTKKVRHKKRRFSLRYKIILATTLMTVSIGVALTWFFVSKFKGELRHELQLRGRSEARNLAYNSRYAILNGDITALNQLVERTVNSPQMLYAVVLDNDGKVMASKYKSYVFEKHQTAATQESLQERAPIIEEHTLKYKAYQSQKAKALKEHFYNVSAPVMVPEGTKTNTDVFEQFFLTEGDTSSNILVRQGEVRIGISLVEMYRKAQNILLFGIFISIGIVGSAAGVAFFLARLIIRPIEKVAATATAIAEGQLEKTVKVETSDEIGLMAENFNRMTQTLRGSIEKETKARKLFARYVPEKVVSEVLERTDEQLFSGQNRSVSILFLDIRNFTPFVKRHKPEEVVDILNKFFSGVSKIVVNRGGIVDKFIGDGVLAVFGAPTSLDNHALSAVLAAMDIQKNLEAFNHWAKAKAGESFEIGIGINSGEVISGNVGSEEKMEYTVVGDAVNIASRIEGLTKESPNSVLISKTTYDDVRDKIKVSSWGKKNLKGHTEGIEIFEVLGCNTPLT